ECVDDILTQGKDLAWESAMNELRAEHEKAQADRPDDEQEEFDEDSAAVNLGINWESSLSNVVYEKDGYKITGCLDFDLFVLNSPYFTFAQFCSPCVPGAGNLDS